MFQLTWEEAESLRSQFATLNSSRGHLSVPYYYKVSIWLESLT